LLVYVRGEINVVVEVVSCKVLRMITTLIFFFLKDF